MEKEISPGWNGLADHGSFQSLYLFGPDEARRAAGAGERGD